MTTPTTIDQEQQTRIMDLENKVEHLLERVELLEKSLEEYRDEQKK
jgi:hypothetical protein